ncbi:hypothetical protein FQN55_000176 [Onygenales sp. PD_40]|nr:hypothetical protein FQN55_000176 [Onygenales sp. PD_40]KAK2780969.1 hypothetical protein FQN52_001966 [Onygenales sp. PD_12]KAK2790811.1 hypothetical protein FQN53_008634 [Emmonsiellopsis sp. PD_33]KAK2804638.1 hypothetical protein FQN51_001840 [Onygenales sp. PD_10]
MADTHPPLSYEASATTTHPLLATSLPSEVVSCLKNARFLHLATCDTTTPTTPTPHVSLMSYTYLPSTPFTPTPTPTIIMTTNASSKKTLNLLSNPRVSLLVHDWVSHRPPTRTRDVTRDGSPPPAATRSSLASLLLNLNTSALSSISTTIIGEARLAEQGGEEERWCKARHAENNTFAGDAEEGGSLFAAAREGGREGEDAVPVTVDETARVVIVEVKEGRIADWKGGVRDWRVVGEGEAGEGQGEEAREDRGLTNGVRYR